MHVFLSEVTLFLPGLQHLCHTERFFSKMMVTLLRGQFNFELTSLACFMSLLRLTGITG